MVVKHFDMGTRKNLFILSFSEMFNIEHCQIKVKVTVGL